MRPLAVSEIQIRDFRNLARVEVVLGRRFNVVAGDNGQGKTNLLEALYVACTSKSFRTANVGDLVAFGAEQASVRARVEEAGVVRVQSVGLRRGARVVRVDDKRPPTLAAYAVKTPAVVFHPGEISLSMGPSGERRRLLDRTALYLEPSSRDEAASYDRAIKARQRILDERGPPARDLGEWETLAARHGVALMQARARAAAALSSHARAAFARIGSPSDLGVAYAPSAPESEEPFRAALFARRAADARRGSAGTGPHRDDLSLSIGGRPVRGVASQGQHRAVTLALKAAEISVIGDARGARPVLLLDDVSSELDRTRTAALFAFLREQEGQVVLTTTRPEMIDTGEGDRVDFSIESGAVRTVGSTFERRA